MDELDWLEDVLVANNFNETPDLQFMVDLNNPDRPFTIIDGAKFKIAPEAQTSPSDRPGKQIDILLDQLDSF